MGAALPKPFFWLIAIRRLFESDINFREVCLAVNDAIRLGICYDNHYHRHQLLTSRDPKHTVEQRLLVTFLLIFQYIRINTSNKFGATHMDMQVQYDRSICFSLF